MVLFFTTACKFLTQLNVCGSLYFRLKMNNTRARRALFKTHRATVLEDYLRMDRTLSPDVLQRNLPQLLETLLHETAWSLGLQISTEELHTLLAQLLKEVHK